MKKRLLCLLAGAAAAVFLFTGCKTPEEKAVEKYKAALEKGREMESYTTTGTIAVELGISGLNMDIDMTLDGAVKDKGQTAAYHMVTEAMGQKTESDMYTQGEYLYTSIPNSQGKFIKQSYEEATGMQYQQLLDFSNTKMTDLYAQAIDKTENLAYAELVEKAVNVTFDFPQEILTSMEDTMVELISGNMIGSMEDTLREQFAALGLAGEELEALVEQMMAVYQEMFSSIALNKISMNATMNKAGYMINQKMTMELTIDFSSLLELLGEASDPAAVEQLKNISYVITADVSTENINEDVAVEIPDISEENILTPEEAVAYQLAA